jgi:TetR/AcrR family transcriptional repressor of bet genes
MPRHVDHAARRRHVAVTAAELVGTHGLDALTFRNVADAAGCSTTVVTHYFTDKRDLLLSTFREVADRLGARFDEAQRKGGGLRGCLEALLPIDAGRRTEWRLLTCFWGVAISDPEFAAEDAGHVRSAQARIMALLRHDHPDVVDAELDGVARRLVTIVHGLGAQSALDPDHWSPAQQRRMIVHELNCLGLPSRVSAAETAAIATVSAAETGGRP